MTTKPKEVPFDVADDVSPEAISTQMALAARAVAYSTRVSVLADVWKLLREHGHNKAAALVVGLAETESTLGKAAMERLEENTDALEAAHGKENTERD